VYNSSTTLGERMMKGAKVIVQVERFVPP